jgi:xylan 1,4-beta-xylosidase
LSGDGLMAHALLAALLAATPVATFDWVDYRGADPVDAAPLLPGHYRNPILQGFYPDPSIVRVGRDYYLVNSTFGWFPGIPVFHSRDLVTWRQVGNAIDRPDQLGMTKINLSSGLYAPAITHRAGLFYIVNTCVDCGGNFVLTARNPAGPWSAPRWLPTLVGGIDPSLFFDDDGQAWIVNNGPPEGKPRYDGHRAIWIQRFDPATLTAGSKRTVLIDGGIHPEDKPVWIEGPHLFKRDGWYYLTCAEGGTGVNHSQVVLRARAPEGPYEAMPEPILTQRDLPERRPNPVTSAGHADFTTTPDGRWWATFLAVRPYQGDLYTTGRETFLLPVEWQDGWPRILPPGTPVPLVAPRPALAPDPPAPPTSGAFGWREEFDRPTLARSWMMMRRPDSRWYRIAGGTLRLDARPVGLGDMGNPSFLARRQQHANAVVTTRVRFAPLRTGDSAGLAALQNDNFWYAIAIARGHRGRLVQLRARAGASDPKAGRVLAKSPLPSSNAIGLRIAAEGSRYRFEYTVGDTWRALGSPQDAAPLTTARAGGFVGTMIGPFAEGTR